MVGLSGIVGWSKAIDKCHNIWDAFANERTNAPARIRQLVNSIGHLHSILKFLDDNYQDTYPLKPQFLSTLSECEAFINSYRALDDRTPSPSGKPLAGTLRHPWDTALYGLGGAEQYAVELSRKLISQQQNLTIFLLSQFLKPASSTYDDGLIMATPSETSSERGRYMAGSRENLTPEEQLEKFHRSFQILRNKYERVTSTAAQQSRAPDLSGLLAEYERQWFHLCNHVGLPSKSRPAMPAMDRIIVNPWSVSNDVRINSERSIPAAKAFPSPTPGEEFQFETPSTLAMRTNTTETTPQSTSYPHPGPAESVKSAESIFLPEPGLEEHIASIDLIRLPGEDFEARLGRWTECMDGPYKTITWDAIEPRGKLRHSIPPNVYPVSMHSSHNKPLHMRFLKDKKHILTWIDEHGIEHPQEGNPKYEFMETDPYKEFQGVVRDKQLLFTYYADSIFSNRQTKPNAEALFVVIKIWQEERPAGKEYSMTYLRTKGMYGDFPLSCFARPAVVDMTSTSKCPVTLEAHGCVSNATAGPSKTRRKSSIWKSKDRLRPSFSKHGSIDAEAVATGPQDEALDGVQWLEINFTTKTGAEDFTRVFNATTQSISNSNSPNINPVFRTESMQSTLSSHNNRQPVLSPPFISKPLPQNDGPVPSRLSDSPSPRSRPRTGPAPPDMSLGGSSYGYFDRRDSHY